jgi:hypothetical protein
LQSPPGRDFIVAPGHSFAPLADAINGAFARWDRSHLHGFELADGRQIGYPNEDFGPDEIWLDHEQVKVTTEVKPGDAFMYVFDFGDDWRHRCTVAEEKVDPIAEYGQMPLGPVITWGCGSIRTSSGAGGPEGTLAAHVLRSCAAASDEQSLGRVPRSVGGDTAVRGGRGHGGRARHRLA